MTVSDARKLVFDEDVPAKQQEETTDGDLPGTDDDIGAWDPASGQWVQPAQQHLAGGSPERDPVDGTIMESEEGSEIESQSSRPSVIESNEAADSDENPDSAEQQQTSTSNEQLDGPRLPTGSNIRNEIIDRSRSRSTDATDEP